ncbi:MAG: hypothetical protein AAGD38_04645 [Acidobacteriota bacterium]
MPKDSGSAKAAMLELIDQLPADSTWDDLVREIAFAGRIERGLADVAAGDLIPLEQLRDQVDQWRH